MEKPLATSFNQFFAARVRYSTGRQRWRCLLPLGLSFGWVLALTRKSYGNVKASHEVTECTPTELKGIWSHLPTLVLTDYARYLEEDFHTRDIDSSSLCTKTDQDVIMTFGTLRTSLSLRLASLHVRGHHDERCDFDLSPDLRNSIFSLTNSLLMYSGISMQLYSGISVQLTNLQSSICCPSVESISVTAPGISQVTKSAPQKRLS
jgi:hypothetical protein